jgi:hypothetical protein
VPPTVRDQFTPPEAVSFCKFALNEMPPAFAFTLPTLSLIVTAIAGFVMVNAEKSDFELSCTEVALSVTCVFGGRDVGAL